MARLRSAAEAPDAADAKDAAPERPPKRASTRRKRARADSSAEREEQEERDAEELVARVSRSGARRPARRGQAAGAILAEFSSLDALLSYGQEEQRKKQQHARKLQRLRADAAAADDANCGGAGDGSALGRLVLDMESNMSNLAADSDLFAAAELAVSEEKFGYVFMPITEPLPFRAFSATQAELESDLGLVYRAMQAREDAEIAALLWSKAIVLRCLLGGRALLPARVSAWLFATSTWLLVRVVDWTYLTWRVVSTHRDGHVVRGCFSNLFLVLSSHPDQPARKLGAALPSASFGHPIEDFRSLFGATAPELGMEWRPSVRDFLDAFRAYGFQDSKRSMSVKSKISTTPTAGAAKDGARAKALPFPAVNMRYVLMFMVVCLRAKLLHLDGYDAFSFTMFFLRMQFEADMHPDIVDLATICIEELLDVFPPAEWRKEWAPTIVLRIAGVKEGLFGSADGWLAVARRLPRTVRGTHLTTGLAIYVLQHRIDKTHDEGATSERPLKFPIQSGLVVDIVAGIVEDLTTKYVEKKRKDSKASKKSSPPPFDLLCKKVALMDLALQAFLNILTPKEMGVMLTKLDGLASAHKSTMSAKWHELKTLVSLMRRKYSRDNLRIGRSSSPPAKTALFCDDD